MKVTFLGFGVDTNARWIGDSALENVWTCNDWWAFYPDFHRPARVYQIHKNYDGKHANDESRNWPDWKERYNKSGALIVTRNHFDSLEKQCVFDEEWGVNKFRKGFFGSSLGYMFADAIYLGVNEIEMLGCRLSDAGEYAAQLDSVRLNMQVARDCGIVVKNEYERQWNKSVDWAGLRSVEMMYGSC